MRCEICGRSDGLHDCRCPMYSSNAIAICDVYGQEIQSGEQYIENDKGKCIHYGCEKNLQWLLEWLGYEIKGG